MTWKADAIIFVDPQLSRWVFLIVGALVVQWLIHNLNTKLPRIQYPPSLCHIGYVTLEKLRDFSETSLLIKKKKKHRESNGIPFKVLREELNEVI